MYLQEIADYLENILSGGKGYWKSEEEVALGDAIEILNKVQTIADGEAALKELKEYVRKTD